MRALEKDPRRRYANANRLAEDLQRAINGQPIVARPVNRFQKVARWANANAMLAVSLGLLGIAMTLGTIVSTTLWVNSEYHAQRSDESREQLIASVKTMVSSSLKQKSTYMNMSGDDRTRAVRVVADTYKRMFVTRVDDDLELVRELAVDLAEATEVNLSLSFFWGAAELMGTNRHLVEELMSMPAPTDKDRAVAAWFYNQVAEFLLNHKAKTNALASGHAAWKAEFISGADATIQARESLMKVLELTSDARDPMSDLSFHHLYASWRLLLMEENIDERIAELATMLKEVELVCASGPDLSAKWVSLHQRMLIALAKKHEGLEAIEYRKRRGQVFKDDIAYLDSKGQETYWYERDTAVNDFFIGLGLLRLGKADEARPLLDMAIERLGKLVAAFPSNSQFGADLAEACLVLVETDWRAKKTTDAMKSYQRTLDAFEGCLKNDSGEISIRRRCGRINDLVAHRYLEMSNFQAAADCFSRGADHFLAVFQSPYDRPSKKQDKAMHVKMTKMAKEAIAKIP